MHYGFLDESGILEKKAGEGSYFIISVVIVANPAEIKDVVRVARKRVPSKFRAKGIFKARHAHPALVKAILKELVRRKVEIVVGVWDKRRRTKRIDKNELYRRLIARTVKMTFKLYPKLDLSIHKRYADPKLQTQLHDAIVRGLKKSGFIAIGQYDERQRKELELADAVAYAVFQKYNRRKSEFYEIIKEKIKKESRLAT